MIQTPDDNKPKPSTSETHSDEPGGTRPQYQTEEAIQAWLVSYLAGQLGVQPQGIDIREPFDSYGLSSRERVELSGDLMEWLGRVLPPSLTWDHPTIEALARHLADPTVEFLTAHRLVEELDLSGSVTKLDWVDLLETPVFNENGKFVRLKFVPVLHIYGYEIATDRPGRATWGSGIQLPSKKIRASQPIRASEALIVRAGTNIPHPAFSPLARNVNVEALIDRTNPPLLGVTTYGFIGQELAGDRARVGEPVDILIFLDAPSLTPFGLVQQLQAARPLVLCGEVDPTGSQFLKAPSKIRVEQVSLLVASGTILDQNFGFVGESELMLTDRRSNRATLSVAITNAAETARFRWTAVLLGAGWKLSRTSATIEIQSGDTGSFALTVAKQATAGTVAAVALFVERLDSLKNVNAISSVTGYLIARDPLIDVYRRSTIYPSIVSVRG